MPSALRVCFATAAMLFIVDAFPSADGLLLFILIDFFMIFLLRFYVYAYVAASPLLFAFSLLIISIITSALY